MTNTANKLYSLDEIDRQCPWACLSKSSFFTAALFDESLVCLNTLKQLTQPLPDFFSSSVKQRQSEYLAGRLCAGDAISRLSGHWSTPGTRVSGAPCWPSGISGSISHCGQCVVAIAMNSRYAQSVGIDLEELIPAEQVDSLSEIILNTDEKQRLLAKGQTLWEQRVNLTLAFSLKESLFKALFPLAGKHFYFEAAEVLSCSANSQARLRLLEDLSPQLKAGMEITGNACFLRGNILTIVLG